jgi:exosortase A-associated hydrolase 2
LAQHPEAFFLPAGDRSAGQRFCLFHRAEGPVRGRIVYLHPFAEEMNKSRRMAALQSRALAAAGFSVLQIDLLGCGDSSGDFGDASWPDWIADVRLACDWLRRRDAEHAAAPLWLWGLRAGCLLAVDAAAGLDEVCNFCFWQPPASGKLLLQQFLRLRLAADMLGGAAKGQMQQMRAELAEGRSLEIAGYQCSAGLAQGLEQAMLTPPLRAGRLEWFELATRPDAALSPSAEQTLAQWRTAGWRCGARPVQGPPFWQTAEIEEAPALLRQTLAALPEALPAATHTEQEPA